MAGATPSFLAFAAVVILLSNLVWRLAWRQAVLLIASLLFLWLCAAGESWIPLMAFVGFGYLGLKWIESDRVRSATPIVVAVVLSFAWLKKYTFVRKRQTNPSERKRTLVLFERGFSRAVGLG